MSVAHRFSRMPVLVIEVGVEHGKEEKVAPEEITLLHPGAVVLVGTGRVVPTGGVGLHNLIEATSV